MVCIPRCSAQVQLFYKDFCTWNCMFEIGGICTVHLWKFITSHWYSFQMHFKYFSFNTHHVQIFQTSQKNITPFKGTNKFRLITTKIPKHSTLGLLEFLQTTVKIFDKSKHVVYFGGHDKPTPMRVARLAIDPFQAGFLDPFSHQKNIRNTWVGEHPN